MFKSRKRYNNGYITLAIDTVSGEILELVSNKNGDNLIKSTPFNLPNMFALSIGSCRLSVPNMVMVRDNPELCVHIDEKRKDDGTEIKLTYNKLSDGSTVYDISVSITIFLPDGSSRLTLSADVNNSGGYDTDTFCFPILSSVYLGENYRDDTLVFPLNAGMKFHNPIDFFAKKPKNIFWRWQEYRYCYNLEGCCGVKNSDGVYSYSGMYSGALSMAWLDLYDEHNGLYFGMHERNGLCRLRADTLGPDSPGMIFSFEKTVEHSSDFCLHNVVIALHEGDWHCGARIYSSNAETPARNEPLWWKSSVYLVAHYDFKYQNGGIVHRFADIPGLVEQAKLLHSDHLLFSGWHTDGFDNGFPEYEADKELGTKKELADGLKYAAENGIKVSFYINTRMANRKYAHLAGFINDSVIIKRDGNPAFEGCGDKTLSFATMCANSAGWKDRLLQAIEYVVDLGATGVYLDQLAMAPPKTCHSKTHKHPYDGWCDGYRDILERANGIKTKSGDALSIIIEGCSDIYGSVVNGGLVSTFMWLHSGAFPEMYRYTFPNHNLVDMVYPKQNLAMRPVHVAQRSSDFINKAFVTDMYFWIYDLEEDNSFFGDPMQLDYLLKVLDLKRYWHQNYPDFVFSDEAGIVDKSEELLVKTFIKDEDMCLIAYASDGKTVCDLKIAFSAEIIESRCIEGTEAVSEVLDPDRFYLRISYSRCGIVLLKRK